MIREIEKALAAAAEQMEISVTVAVQRSDTFEHGDYQTNVAFAAGTQLKKAPLAVAQALAGMLHIEGVEKIEAVAPGFINFFLSPDFVARQMVQAATDRSWGRNTLRQGEMILVEYTQPNPFKPFHIGHLMSNTIGESLACLLENAGATVIRANYQGDIGLHVAKAIFVLLVRNVENPTVDDLGRAYVEGTTRYEENPADREAIDALNKKLYEKCDEKINTLYERGRKISLDHFEELYAMLGTKFDFYFFESETGPRGVALVRARPDIFEESDGAVVFRGDQYGLHTRVFVNRLGLPTYEAKDLGLAELKKEKVLFAASITVTANEQDEYFKVVFKALELAHPEWAGQFTHVSHGMMRFAQGKMSSRWGNIITGESLLMDLKDASKEKMQGRELNDAQKTAEEVAVGAVKYAVLKQGSNKDIIFDPEESLSLEGGSGPYLQYAHTRALSLVKAAEKAGITPGLSDATEGQGSVSASALERTLIHFPEVAERAASTREPHYVTTYLTELASVFNSWYAQERIIGGTRPHYGLLLAQAFVDTMHKGLTLLSIPAPVEM